MANFPMFELENCKDLRLRLDNATLSTNVPNMDITRVNQCTKTDISMKGAKVVSASGGGGRHCDGTMTVNDIIDSEGININQDGMSISGRFSDVTMNKTRGSKKVEISQRGMVIDADYHDGTPREDDRARRHLAGKFTGNEIRQSENVKIDQEDMAIAGRFKDVQLNDVAQSSDVAINQKNADVDVYDSGSSSDDDSDDDLRDNDARHITDCVEGPPSSDNYESGKSHQSRGSSNNAKRHDVATETQVSKTSARMDPAKFDEDGLPKSSTYEYRVAEKYSFNVKLKGGGSVTCTRLRIDRVRNLIAFIKKIHPPSGFKPFRLRDENTERFVDEDPDATLEEAGFTDEMELRTVYDT